MSEPDDDFTPDTDVPNECFKKIQTLVGIPPAELARLRQNSERWRWAYANPLAYWRIAQSSQKWEVEARVDAAIAAERGDGK